MRDGAPRDGTAVSPKAFEQGIGSLAHGGTLVCVGLPAENELVVPIFQTVLGRLTVKGSIVGTHHDLEEVFEVADLPQEAESHEHVAARA